MSIITVRRRHEDAPIGLLNDDVAQELSAAATRHFTGSLEVTDRSTKGHGRLFLYEGGLYAIELDGYEPDVLSRLRSSGALDHLSPTDIAELHSVDPALAGARAVEREWVRVDVLAGLHQEYVLAGLGALLTLARAKVRPRKGDMSSCCCTMPLPVEPLFDTVRMRMDRLAGTAAMLAPGRPPGSPVLRRTLVPASGTAHEVAAVAGAIDGQRSLDALAGSLGLTRAEAVHVASLLVRGGMASVDVEAVVAEARERHPVPESFGEFAATARPRMRSATLSTPVVAADDHEPPAPVPSPSVEPSLEIDDSLTAARAVVTSLLDALQESVACERAAIARTADISQQLRDARMALARLEGGALALSASG